MRQQEVHLSTSLRHKAPRHAVLVSVQCPDRSDAAAERSLNELEQLLRGLGIRVHARLVQKRQHPTATYVGEGKLRELAGLTGGSGKVSRVPIPSGSAPRAGAIGLVVVDDEDGEELRICVGSDVGLRTMEQLGTAMLSKGAIVAAYYGPGHPANTPLGFDAYARELRLPSKERLIPITQDVELDKGRGLLPLAARTNRPPTG